MVVQSRDADDSRELSSTDSVARTTVGVDSWGISLGILAVAIIGFESEHRWKTISSSQGSCLVPPRSARTDSVGVVADGARSSAQASLSSDLRLVIRNRLLSPRRLGELDARYDSARIVSSPALAMGTRIHLLRFESR